MKVAVEEIRHDQEPWSSNILTAWRENLGYQIALRSGLKRAVASSTIQFMQSESINSPFVLIAEDNPDDRRLLQYAFRSAQLPNPCLIVNDGAEAIAWMQKLARLDSEDAPPIELLVVDIHMPNKTGFEVLEWVRTQSAYQDLPVVVMNGLHSPAMVEHALESGAHSYLFKPGDYGELIKFIGDFNTVHSVRAECRSGK